MYIPADQLESDDWAGTLVHEFTHFEEGSREYANMVDFLQSDEILVDDDKGGKVKLSEKARSTVLAKSYGFTVEQLDAVLAKANTDAKLTAEESKIYEVYATELTAHETEIVLGNEEFVDRIIAEDGSAAERLVSRILKLDKGLSSIKDKQARAQAKLIKQAEKLYLKAAESAGNKRIMKMILAQRPELEEELENSSDNALESTLFAENEQKSPITDTNAEKMQVKVQYDLKYSDAVDLLDKGELNRTQNTHLKLLDHTPQLYIDKANAKDLKIVMAWDIAYLAMNRNGDIPGNYHSLGPDIMKAIPDAIKDPLYIIKQENGRIIAVTEIVVKGNRSTIASIELDTFKSTTQDGQSESDNYNLIVTIMDAKPNYLQNTIFGGKIVYNKNNEDPADFILRLKSLKKALSNDDPARSSNNSISDSSEKSNSFDKKTLENISRDEKNVQLSLKSSEYTVNISKGELAKIKANYKSDKVFTKNDVTKAINSIEAIAGIRPQLRNELINRVWKGYNERLDMAGYEKFTEVMYHRIHATILQETSFEMNDSDIVKMDEHIAQALVKIVESGKPSEKAKLESATSTEGYRKQAEYWRNEHIQANERRSIEGRIMQLTDKVKNIKKGAYLNASQYNWDIKHYYGKDSSPFFFI